MRLRQIVLPLLAVLLVATACKKKDPVAMPTPAPAPGATPAPAPPPPPPPGTTPTGDANAAIERARTEMVNTLAEQVHFDFDRFDIRAQDEAVLERKVALLQRYPQVRLRIAGHADDRGSDEYNLVLGNKRALAAKAWLERRGIDGSRIDVVSYGEERPLDTAATEDAWSRNRRDEFEVVAGRDSLGRPR